MLKTFLMEPAKNPTDFASSWLLIFTIDLPSEGRRLSLYFTIGLCIHLASMASNVATPDSICRYE